LSIFMKIKLLFINRDSSILLLFYLLCIISAFVTNIMSFIEGLLRLRISLFRYVFCRWESSKTCYFSTVLSLLSPIMVSLSHIYCIAFNLGQNFKAKIWEPTCALFSDKANPIRVHIIWKLIITQCKIEDCS